MRLHHLRATAFGPFGDEIDLDLEQISASGLFLVHGPTGAGKTSLLDAICFALYAAVPGDRQATTLRSHHADPSRPTVVTLELTLADRRLRISRSPAHERPKKRGTGMTTEPARVQLEEFAHGAWSSLSSRIDETARVVDDLLGMALDQFRRVVMLPQGDFAAFLRASDEERREVLERLFDVTDFVAVEEHLVERRQQARSTLAGMRSSLAGHTLRLEELLTETETELPTPDTSLDALSPEELLRTVGAIDDALEAHAAEIMTVVDRAQQEAAAARAALAAGERTEELRARGERARRLRTELLEVAEAHTSRRSRLARGRDAAAVLPHVEAVERAGRAVDAARSSQERARALVPTAPSGPGLTGLVDTLTREAEGLSGAAHEADALARLREELPRTTQRTAQRDAEVTAASESLDTARERFEEVRDARAEVEASEERLRELVPVLTLTKDLARARSQVAGAEDSRRRSTDVRQQAQQAALDLRERVQSLVQRRLDTMAGELAEQLRDGEPCSVCGALEHPDPATASRQVTPEEIEDARSEAAAADARLEEARSHDESVAAQLEVARGRVADIESQLGADDSGLGAELASADDLADRLDRLGNERAALLAVTERRDAVERALATTEADITRAEAGRAAALTARTEAEALLRRLSAEIASSTARLAEAVLAHESSCPCAEILAPAPVDRPGPHTVERVLEAASEHHGAALDAVTRIITASEEIERMLTTHDEAAQLLDEALTTRDFADAESVRAASLGREAMADLEHEVAEHDRRLASVESVLAEEDVLAALATEPVDLAHLRAIADRTHREADQAGRRQASVQTVLRQFTAVHEHLERTCTDLGPALEEAELVTRMSELVSGTSRDNDKRMRLSTYVLAARLERIVELANERLLGMADGRYELAHHDAAGRGQRRGGLGLLVRDLWTGLERPTDTLSGGESFTASLALALGLADAIREESGGREFGTLFVDEGFGSLDQDSLEQVLDVLDRLRDGGRTVGVVSHVTEMRNRIPTQVRVDKTPHGSSVQVLDHAAADVA